MRRIKAEDREAYFWSRVNRNSSDDSCWEWKGARGARGYGHVRWDGVVQYAHRIAYQLTHDDLGDLCVLHRCDNRLCCNPSHLFKGTYADNNLDKMLKGRAVGFAGEQNPSSVLSWDKVREIRRLYAAGTRTQAQLGRMNGVTQTLIYYIVNGKKWVERHEI